MSRFSHIIRKIIRDLALVDLGWKYKNSKGHWVYVGEDESKIPKYAKDQKVETRKKKLPAEKPVKKVTAKKSPVKKTKQTTLPEEPSIPKQESYTADEVKKYAGKDVPEGEYSLIPIHKNVLVEGMKVPDYFSDAMGFGNRIIDKYPEQIAPVGDEAFVPKQYAGAVWAESRSQEKQEYIKNYLESHNVPHEIDSRGYYVMKEKNGRKIGGMIMGSASIDELAEARGENNWRFDREFGVDNTVRVPISLKQAAQQAIKSFLGKVNDDSPDMEDEYLYALATKQHPSHKDHPIMTYIADQIGFHAPPKVISDEEFDKFNTDENVITLRRGVGGASIPGFIDGTNKIQRYGIYGSGCYSMVCQVEDVYDPKAVGCNDVNDPECKKRHHELFYDTEDKLYGVVRQTLDLNCAPQLIKTGKELIKLFNKYKKEGLSFDETYEKVRDTYHKEYWDKEYEASDKLYYYGSDTYPRTRSGLVTNDIFFTEHGSDSSGRYLGWDKEDMKARYAVDPKAVKSENFVDINDWEGMREDYKKKYASLDDATRYKNFEKNMKEVTQRYADAYDAMDKTLPPIESIFDNIRDTLPESTLKIAEEAARKIYEYEMLPYKQQDYKNRPSFSSLIYSQLPTIKVKTGADKAQSCADMYAEQAREQGKEGFVMKLAVDPSAKLTTYDDVKRAELDLNDLGITDPTDQRVFRIMMNRDPGLKAMLMGYDGYVVDKGHTNLDEVDYMLMFNRSKLMIVDPREGKNE